jgi:energy-coupling factor transporter ATP-binding protein EcfA2
MPTEMKTEPSRVATPDGLRKRINALYTHLKAFIEDKGNPRFRALWEEWEGRLRHIFELSKQSPEVAVSLVGDTGVGKSTLLNALIGARVLPVSNMRACTAAITEVGYYPGMYRAQIEFVSRESWQREIDLLLGDWQDVNASAGEDANGDPWADMSRAVRDRLWAVYKPADDADPKDFNPLDLVEPPEITTALDVGMAELQATDLNTFRKEVAQYLESRHRFWPIVKRVSVQGPFQALRDGAKVIDLPGINDPNEAREEVTRLHLKTCRFVWMVFNIKRALTKATINLFQSDDFVRQVVMDGRTNAMTFVGTASDDVDQESGIEEFGLSEDASVAEVIAARNTAVRGVIREQLEEVVSRLASAAREEKQGREKVEAGLKASRIFTVSAREYLRLCGLAKTQASGLTTPTDTEVPALLSHMRTICADYGIAAHCNSLNRQLDVLLAEIKREIQSQQAIVKHRVEINEHQRQEVGAAANTALEFLAHELEVSKERLEQDLAASHELLAERVKRAVERARQDLDHTFTRWQRVHHMTLRAVCRRGGSYVGSTGKNDLPADLSKPILDSIAFAWSDFFSEKLRIVLEKWTDALLRNADEFRRQVLEAVSAKPDLPPGMLDSQDRIMETTEKVLRELLAQTNTAMEARIQDDQRNLYERVPAEVRANMQEAFERAADERGTGMKQRMVAILAEHAARVSQVMFDDARDAILSGLRGLTDWLVVQYGEMIGTVNRHASLAAENLLVSGERLSEDTIARNKQPLEEMAVLVDSLLSDGA